MNGSAPSRDSIHILLTVLGTKPRPACYALGERRAEAPLAPLALLDLLPEADRPERVVALCTAEAKKDSWSLLQRGLDGRCEAEAVDVPGGNAQEDVDAYLARVSSVIPGKREVHLTLDVTHGYRHFSFLTYTAVLYLTALRGVRVRGAYYGLLRDPEKGMSRFLDLRPLLVLPRWFHAVEVLRETGSALPMARALAEEPQRPSARALSRELSRISEAYLSGLPLELGRHARLFREQRTKALKKLFRDHGLPLAAELVERLTETLDPFVLPGEVSGEGWKKGVVLSQPELARQARLIDDLLERRSFAAALGLMNEWTVSWVAWRRGCEGGWLDYDGDRRSAAGLLGAIAAVAGNEDPALDDVLTGEQRALGRFWRLLGSLRNAYHHHGMRSRVLVGDKQAEKEFKEVRDYWESSLRSCPDIPLSLGGGRGGRVLVSPIGRRPGVLFSAVHACRAAGGAPDDCLAICSRDTEGLIAEALRQAGYRGGVQPVLLDPYGGPPEIERVGKETRKRLVVAAEVFVNVTGGTTLMGLAAEALADTARRFARRVHRFGLIDRRPPQQQDADPYRKGEPFWLEGLEE